MFTTGSRRKPTVSLRDFAGICLGAAILTTAPASAQSTSPYLLPYTINTIAGGGTAPKIGGVCAGQTVAGTAADILGDGCQAGSSSVVLTGIYQYAVAVDSKGNIYFTEAGSTSSGYVRVIDAHTGIIHIFAGASSKICNGTPSGAPTAISKYGDGCYANDGLANASGNYTVNLGTSGLDVARNGDVYLASGSNSMVHKIDAATGIMSPVAGYLSGSAAASGYTGDGGPALSGSINTAQGVAVASNGDIYIADSANNVVRKITAATGIISTFAGVNPGNNSAAPAAYTGDGGLATAAAFNQPFDVKVDANNNVFIVDYGNKAVRVVYNSGAQVANLIAVNNPGFTAIAGHIYTIWGGSNASGTPSSSTSSGKLGTVYKLGSPRKIALDSHGNIYLGDSGTDMVAFLDGTTGFTRVIAGIRSTATSVSGPGCATSTSATLGDGCPATQATLVTTGGAAKSTIGVDIDPFGNLILSDNGNFRIRKVSTGAQFPLTNAGTTTTQTLEVHFNPGDLPAATNPFVLSSADYVLTNTACTTNSFDSTTDCLLTISFTPRAPGADNATLTTTSTVSGATSFALTGSGNAPSIAVDPGTTSVPASGLTTPAAAATDAAGNIYVADTGKNRIVRVAPGGTASVIAGTGTSGYSGDNAAATAATLSAPRGVAVTADGTVYIADTGNNVIRAINPGTGIITTVAGGASANCTPALDSFGDGCIATQVKLNAPAGIAVDTQGFVYISDTGNNIVRELTPDGTLFLAVGGATAVCAAATDVYGNNCAPSQITLNKPTALAFSPANNLYIADTGDNMVREFVAAKNTVVAIAGNGQAGGYGDTGLATGAQLSAPTGVAVDSGGDVYIADTGNHAVRLVNATGDINTVTGTLGVQGATTTTSAASITLHAPSAVLSTGNGTLTIVDAGNNRLVNVTRSTSSYNFGYVNPGQQSNGVRYQETNTGSIAASLPSPMFSGGSSSFSLASSGSNGCSSGTNLTPGGSCYLLAAFTPAGLGAASATFTQTAVSSTSGVNVGPIAISLVGTGANLVQTTTTNVLNVPSPPYGTSIDVTTTITGASCSSSATTCQLTGSVQYFVDGVAVGAPYSVSATAGQAKATVHGLLGGQNQGNHIIVAVYSGDPNYQGSTSANLSVGVAGAVTTTVVTLTPATLNQFDALTLSAKISSPISSAVPTGTVKFYAGSTLLGTSGVNPLTAVATLADTTPATTMGLYAGTYNITAVYSGDVNFSTSTSAAAVLTVKPDPATIALQLGTDPGTGVLIISSTATVGTAQGSTAATNVIITPTNTVNDTFTFSCSGLPQYSSCTFSPYQVSFTSVPGAATAQYTQVTLFTDVDPAVLPKTAQLRTDDGTRLASFGWPVLLVSLGVLFGFRRSLRRLPVLNVIVVLGLAAGSMMSLSGCGLHQTKPVYLTPTGTYNVTIKVTGKSTPTQTIPVTFVVSAGIKGQE